MTSFSTQGFFFNSTPVDMTKRMIFIYFLFYFSDSSAARVCGVCVCVSVVGLGGGGPRMIPKLNPPRSDSTDTHTFTLPVVSCVYKNIQVPVQGPMKMKYFQRLTLVLKYCQITKALQAVDSSSLLTCWFMFLLLL